MKKVRFLILAVLAGAIFAGPALAQKKAPVRKLTKITGELYRFQNNFHFSIVAVTPAGVIVSDPINAGAAKWLSAEIKKRFNQPIKYVVYSHDHADHIAGGEVYKAAGATIVAHAKAKKVIVGEKRPTAVPDVTFRRRLTLSLGGTVVNLIYVGKSHSNNMIVLHFPKERLVHAVDFIPVKTLGFRNLGDAYMPGWVRALRRVERIDFDILSPGHGPMGKKADVAAFRGYMTDLHKAVLAGARAGKSLDQLKKEITLEKYKSWGQYKAWRGLNISGMYRMVQANRRGN